MGIIVGQLSYTGNIYATKFVGRLFSYTVIHTTTKYCLFQVNSILNCDRMINEQKVCKIYRSRKYS